MKLMNYILYTLLGRMGTNAFRVSKGSTPNKYVPHQGKQECQRRLNKAITTV